MNQVLSSAFIRIFGLLLSLLVVFPHCAIAGWFGPDNYEECMLDKMKGQDKSMRSIANNACLAKFPKPMAITEFAGFGDDKDIKLLWDGSNIKIIRNNSSYQITSVGMLLSKENCADTRESTESDGDIIRRLIFTHTYVHSGLMTYPLAVAANTPVDTPRASSPAPPGDRSDTSRSPRPASASPATAPRSPGGHRPCGPGSRP